MHQLYQHKSQGHSALFKYLVTTSEKRLKDSWAWHNKDWEMTQVYLTLQQRQVDL